MYFSDNYVGTDRFEPVILVKNQWSVPNLGPTFKDTNKIQRLLAPVCRMPCIKENTGGWRLSTT